MNTIVGYVNDGKVYVVTDTARAKDNYSFSDSTETGISTFLLPNGVICGVSGYSVKQAMQTNKQWFDGLASEPLTKKFIVQNVVPKLYDKLDELGLIPAEKKEDGESAFDGAIILAQKDKLYCIDSNFSVLAIPRYCIIGEGKDYALPRVILHKDGKVEDMLYDALHDAKVYSCNVREPFYLFTTDATQKQLLRRD